MGPHRFRGWGPTPSKTGAKVVHIGPPALEILANIERLPDNPWVIDGKITLPVRATSPAEAS